MVKKLLLVAGLFGFVIFNTGCAALLLGAGAAAGAGGVAYASGDLETDEEVSFDVAYNASSEALRDMGYTITKRDRDIEETDADGKPTEQSATIKAERTQVVTTTTDTEVEIDDDEVEVEEDEVVETESKDEKVTVKLKSVAPELTEMSIRVGIFGDEDRSRVILERIRRNY